MASRASSKRKVAKDDDMGSDGEIQIETVVGKKRAKQLNESKSQPANRGAKKNADGTEKIIVEPSQPASA